MFHEMPEGKISDLPAALKRELELYNSCAYKDAVRMLSMLVVILTEVHSTLKKQDTRDVSLNGEVVDVLEECHQIMDEVVVAALDWDDKRDEFKDRTSST